MALSTPLANLHLFRLSFVVSLASFHVLSFNHSAELHISSRTLCPSSPATQDGLLRWSPTPGSCWEFWPRYRLLCLSSRTSSWTFGDFLQELSWSVKMCVQLDVLLFVMGVIVIPPHLWTLTACVPFSVAVWEWTQWTTLHMDPKYLSTLLTRWHVSTRVVQFHQWEVNRSDPVLIRNTVFCQSSIFISIFISSKFHLLSGTESHLNWPVTNNWRGPDEAGCAFHSFPNSNKLHLNKLLFIKSHTARIILCHCSKVAQTDNTWQSRIWTSTSLVL